MVSPLSPQVACFLQLLAGLKISFRQSIVGLEEPDAGNVKIGETVKLSSFATFHVRSKNERIGRNPKTGEEVPILPRQVLVFKPSNVLKSKINKSMVPAEK